MSPGNVAYEHVQAEDEDEAHVAEVESDAGKTDSTLSPQKYNWKPISHRTTSLASLCFFTIALIGLLQYAVSELPHRQNTGDLSDSNTSSIAAPSSTLTLHRRAHTLLLRDTDDLTASVTDVEHETATSTEPPPEDLPVITTSTSSESQSESVTEPTTSPSPTSSDILTTSSAADVSDVIVEITHSTTASNAYMPEADPTTSIFTFTDEPPKSTASTAYVPEIDREEVTSTDEPDKSTAPTAYVPEIDPTKSTAATAYVPEVDPTTSTFTDEPPKSTASTAFVPKVDPEDITSATDFTAPTAAGAPIPQTDSDRQDDSTSGSGTSVRQTFRLRPSSNGPDDHNREPPRTMTLATGSEGYVTLTATFATDKAAATAVIVDVPQEHPEHPTSSDVDSAAPVHVVQILDDDGHTIQLATIEPSPTTAGDIIANVEANGPAATTSTKGISASGTNMTDQLVGARTVTLHKWTAVQVFESAYLPVLIAALYRILWAVLYANANLIEPFQQLAKPRGALAESVFFRFYHAQSDFMGPLLALVNRSWNMASILVSYTMAGLIPALISEAFVVNTNWECADHERTQIDPNPCPPYLEVRSWVLRIVQTILAVLALALVFVIYQSLRQKTGLTADPSSMATISSLVRSPDLHRVMDTIPADASTDAMRNALQAKRFRLAHYQTECGSTEYGIIPLAEDRKPSTSPRSNNVQEGAIEESSLLHGDKKSATSRFRILDFVLLATVTGTFAVVLAYYLEGGDSGYNRFFSSDTFGPRFILTGACTIIASIWSSVEQDSMLFAPYNRMGTKPSRAASTILFKPSTAPIFSTIYTTLHGYYFVASLTLMTLLGEALSVVIGGVPFAAGQTWMQFLVSAYMSLAILGLMVIVSVVVIWKRRGEVEMPRKPETLAAVVSYVYASEMRGDFNGMGDGDEKRRDSRIKALGKRYVFEKASVGDGRWIWKVDEYVPEKVDES